ncbi:MAG: GtrA family protein [Eubacteriaceae bacterium]|nr:GtrA family protein [Eubacteriaceae bacterium]MDD4507915.1 GtrA family protein [Eubacteriaceae bacterium]
MNKIKALLQSKRFAEIFRFGVNGGISFVVDYAGLYLLTEFAGIDYLISSGISFTLSVIVNYIICVKWVFEGAQNQNARSKFIFVASSVIGLGLTEFLMWALVNKMGIYYMIAKIISTIIVMIWNYIAKRWALVQK